MQEQPGLWQQNDLLGMAAPLPAAPEPPASPRVAAQLPAKLPTPAPAPAEPSRPTSLSLPACAGRPARALPRVPETLLILDTETTGLSTLQGQCIEVGAILFHVPHRAVLTQVSFLMPCTGNAAEGINGIPAAVTRLEQPWQDALACFRSMVEACEALVAHNVAFDRQWFGLGPLPALDRPWICSMEDIRWPAERQLRSTPSVRDLALAYGVPVWAAHRALTDCIYLAQVFERCTDLEALLQAALEPRSLYRADLSYAERHRAREAGFRWNEAVPRAWSRRLSRREAEALAFPVQLVPDPASGDGLARSA
ncbi:3'-5' exonuclease [Cyanobium sp. Cruz CV13-4-11]|jgi:DNA polymerase III subunit epsilon|uniref:3'-5' exonuclease n=1 Tax=unclassified Cyanobium TaxID=2627006 RepID=UPI0020CC3923|nr:MULTISPECIES: 3'-5' exonuclease [unclassified Cyanobium]MCP9899196.1 3'-5' exonuclease [Cyanobium sp. Cruz CV11-17]MCP9918059.1 3'-5' exonuclease [Cyanobium sp. Cruz CV13-4-11]